MKLIIDIPEEYKEQFVKNKCDDLFNSLATNEFGYVLRKSFETATLCQFCEIRIQPTRPTARWIDIGDEGLVFKCSICGTKKTIESHFCPNCGARMTSEDKE